MPSVHKTMMGGNGDGQHPTSVALDQFAGRDASGRIAGAEGGGMLHLRESDPGDWGKANEILPFGLLIPAKPGKGLYTADLFLCVPEESLPIGRILDKTKTERAVFPPDGGACVDRLEANGAAVYHPIAELFHLIHRFHDLMQGINEKGSVICLSVLIDGGNIYLGG